MSTPKHRTSDRKRRESRCVDCGEKIVTYVYLNSKRAPVPRRCHDCCAQQWRHEQRKGMH